MYHQQIQVGMYLRLKRNRMSDYGMDSPYVRVTAIKANPRYKVPWIMSGTDAFKPSDFECEVSDPRNDLRPTPCTCGMCISQNEEN